MVKEEHPEVVANYFEPLLNCWKDGMLFTLQQPTTPENVMVKNETLKTVVVVMMLDLKCRLLEPLLNKRTI